MNFREKTSHKTLSEQKAQSILSSIIISLLTLANAGVYLSLFLIDVPVDTIEVLITYQAATPEIEQSKPLSPAPENALLITSPHGVSSFVPPPPEQYDTDFSLPEADASLDIVLPDLPELEDFNSTPDFTDFLIDKPQLLFSVIPSKRTCYVIDFSKSMKGAREKLMREELANSLRSLDTGTEYSLIFFSGPVWQAGDETTVSSSNREGEVISLNNGKTYNWRVISGFQNWHPDGRRQKMQWLRASSSSVDKSIQHIMGTSLVYGTRWEQPLKYALEMKPTPEIIVFMTDGASKSSLDVAKEIVRIAKRKRVRINTISMMEPDAVEGITYLAEKTGGSATVVKSKNEIIQLIPF